MTQPFLFPLSEPQGLRWYQEDAVAAAEAALEEYRSCLCVMATGLGKALSVTEPVLTIDGWKPIGRIREGDLVVGKNGRFTRVTGVFPQGLRKLYRVTFSDGAFVDCDSEHLWTVRTKHDKARGRPWRVIPLSQIVVSGIKDGRGYKWQLPMVEPVDYPKLSLPLDPYLLGVLLGDGGFSGASLRLTTRCDVANALDIPAPSRMRCTKRIGGGAAEYVILGNGRWNQNPVVNALKQFGLWGHRSRGKFIPPEYMRSSIEDRLSVLRGLMDTDGHQGKSGHVEFTTVSHALAVGVRELVESLGGIAPMRQKRTTWVHRGIRKRGMAWRLTIALEMSPFRVREFRPRTKYAPGRRIMKIEDVPGGHAVCIKVDAQDGLFVTRNHVVTHNTVVFCELARRFRERGANVLCLAHRIELVEQGKRRLEDAIGESVWIEKGRDWAPNRAGVVFASAQTLARKDRLERFSKDQFGLVIPDEFHHYVSKTWRRPLDYFTGKVFGVTATPDRADEQALGKICDDVCYVRDILDGIQDGFLVPIEGCHVDVEECDISGVDTTGDDLEEGDLDEVMARAVEGVVHELLRLHPTRKGILFFPGIQSAELAMLRLNALTGQELACFIHAKTPPEERRRLVEDFRWGKYRWLVNVGIATEGFDCPDVGLVGIARPTMSRNLFAQMAGRGTRVLPGIVDHLLTEESQARRRQLVSESDKPNCILMDFVGNAGAHNLQTPEDLLGGDFEEQEVKLAKKIATEEQGEEKTDPLAALIEARKRLRHMASSIRAKSVKSKVRSFDPFKAFDLDRSERIVARYGQKKPSERQLEYLSEKGISKAELKKLDRQQASRLITECIDRHERGMASFKQIRMLSRVGIDDPNITSAQASRALDYLAATGWGRMGYDQEYLKQLIGGQND